MERWPARFGLEAEDTTSFWAPHCPPTEHSLLRDSEPSQPSPAGWFPANPQAASNSTAPASAGQRLLPSSTLPSFAAAEQMQRDGPNSRTRGAGTTGSLLLPPQLDGVGCLQGPRPLPPIRPAPTGKAAPPLPSVRPGPSTALPAAEGSRAPQHRTGPTDSRCQGSPRSAEERDWEVGPPAQRALWGDGTAPSGLQSSALQGAPLELGEARMSPGSVQGSGGERRRAGLGLHSAARHVSPGEPAGRATARSLSPAELCSSAAPPPTVAPPRPAAASEGAAGSPAGLQVGRGSGRSVAREQMPPPASCSGAGGQSLKVELRAGADPLWAQSEPHDSSVAEQWKRQGLWGELQGSGARGCAPLPAAQPPAAGAAAAVPSAAPSPLAAFSTMIQRYTEHRELDPLQSSAPAGGPVWHSGFSQGQGAAGSSQGLLVVAEPSNESGASAASAGDAAPAAFLAPQHEGQLVAWRKRLAGVAEDEERRRLLLAGLLLQQSHAAKRMREQGPGASIPPWLPLSVAVLRPPVAAEEGRELALFRSAEDFMREKVLGMARAVQAGNQMEFSAHFTAARALARPGGSAVQRTTHYFANALLRRLQGTAFKFFMAPLRSSNKELLQARQWAIRSLPVARFLGAAAVCSLFEALAGAPRVHIIDLGAQLMVYMPQLLQRLAAQPGGVPAIRVTAVDTSAFVSKGRKQWQSIRAAMETCSRLRALGLQLGVTLRFEYVDTGEKGLQRLYEVRRLSKEALAVHSFVDLQYYADSEGPCSARASVLQWIARLRPNVFHFAEMNVDANNTPYLQRVSNVLEISLNFGACNDAFVDSDHRPMLALFEEQVLERFVNTSVGCEGEERCMRPDSMRQWGARLLDMGFEPRCISKDALAAMMGQASSQDDNLRISCQDLGAELIWRGSQQGAFFSSAWHPPRV